MIQKREKKPKIEVASYKGKRMPLVLKGVLTLIPAGVLLFRPLPGAVRFRPHDELHGGLQAVFLPSG